MLTLNGDNSSFLHLKGMKGSSLQNSIFSIGTRERIFFLISKFFSLSLSSQTVALICLSRKERRPGTNYGREHLISSVLALQRDLVFTSKVHILNQGETLRQANTTYRVTPSIQNTIE